MSEKSPILNNPYEEPLWHYAADLEGNLDYSEVKTGRRPYQSSVGIAPKAATKALFTLDDMHDSDPNAQFINAIRTEVGQWRGQGYPHATRTTRELLNFWFSNHERPNNQRLFFCQREAVETAVYLNEIADWDPNIGRDLLRQLDARVATISDSSDDLLPRTAFKMATGTGKTVVMAMLILYNYFNKKNNPQDTRYCDHFLIVAPGITIRDRLGVLFVDESLHGNRWDKNDYYHRRNLVPQQYEPLLGGLNSAITITNYHQFEPKALTGKKCSPMDGKMVYRNGEMVKVEGKESYASVFARLLGKNIRGRRVLVINDEAHHCYLPLKLKKLSAEEQAENAKAMVWYEGLRQMKLLGIKIGHVYDLSATPYYLKGSGHAEYSLFPWTVSDFGLVDAIESGLVKIPFLPKADNTSQLSEPVLRNIYEHVKNDLPKKGQRAKRKEDAAAATDSPAHESAPHLPALLNMALEQFVKDYEDYERGMRGDGEVAQNLFTTPPVFIVVCNNTTVSKEVYKVLAGYESTDADGNPIYVSGKYDIFSNYQNGLPLQKPPTLLIDSAAIENAGGVVGDEFKAVFRDEIALFKRDYAAIYGAGAADCLTDGDILREVVNSVGKPNTLGAHVRCVVSVSMLTEGWDANTVTHVCGIRAFGSQLLCEQVAGRALRRRSYELVAYTKEGLEVPEERLKRYKPENLVYKFPPEYAHIIGVPFKTFKGGSGGGAPQPKPKTVVKALDERKALEIVFPNIVGYRSENRDGDILAIYNNMPKFQLNFNDIPTQTILGNAIDGEEVLLKSDYSTLRDARVLYELTRWLINIKYTDRDGGRQFQKFAKLKQVVEQWYYQQVEIVGGDGREEQRRLVLFWNPLHVVTSIYEGISSAQQHDESITAILNFYNPEGSTRYVHGATAKPVYPTQKSHVNYVVADTDSWEQIAAKTLEQLPQVKRYVKNHFLDFKIPYMDLNTEEHHYYPDFIAVVETPSGHEVNLVIEISGFSDDHVGHKDQKRYYMEQYWLPAANHLQRYGRWEFIEISDISNIKNILTHKIETL